MKKNGTLSRKKTTPGTPVSGTTGSVLGVGSPPHHALLVFESIEEKPVGLVVLATSGFDGEETKMTGGSE